MLLSVSYHLEIAVNSTPHTYKTCAKCGKGFKIGTNETYDIKINNSVGGVGKSSQN